MTDLEALFLSRPFAHIAKYAMYLSRPVPMLRVGVKSGGRHRDVETPRRGVLPKETFDRNVSTVAPHEFPAVAPTFRVA